MNRKAEILKAGAIIIKERKLLVSRSRGKDVFVAPGGKLEDGKSYVSALARELLEEQSVRINLESLQRFGEFEAIAASDAASRTVRMGVYIVNGYDGVLDPSNEIEENAWVNSKTTLPLGSIFEHDVIPKLVEENLID